MAGRYPTGATGNAEGVPNNAGSGAASAQPGREVWHPEVSYLVLLVIAEYVTLLVLRYVFRHSHGG